MQWTAIIMSTATLSRMTVGLDNNLWVKVQGRRTVLGDCVFHAE